MLKRYLDFCKTYTEKAISEIEKNRNEPVAMPFSHAVFFISIIIPVILFFTQLPVLYSIFLLYGFGTNIYTSLITIFSFAFSAFSLSSGIKGLKNYAHSED